MCPGSYARVLRLSAEGLATLGDAEDSAEGDGGASPRLTNFWRLDEIVEMVPLPISGEGDRAHFTLRVAPVRPNRVWRCGRTVKAWHMTWRSSRVSAECRLWAAPDALRWAWATPHRPHRTAPPCTAPPAARPPKDG